MRTLKVFLLISLVLVFAFSFSAFAGEKRLVLYGSPAEKWVALVAHEFEKATGIPVDWTRRSSGETLAKIKAEMNNPQGDVWFGGTLDPHYEAALEGLLQPYPQSPMIPELRDWAKNPAIAYMVKGLYAGPLGWGVNVELLKSKGIPVPKVWEDLTKPCYKGLIGMANPNTSGTAFTTLSTILQLMGWDKGWDYLKKLHKNIAVYTKSGAASGPMAGKGEIAISIIFLHDVVKFAEQGYPIVPIPPADGTGYEIGGLSIINWCPHPQIAKQFVDFVLRPDIQALAPKAESYQLPSNKKAPLPAVIKKYGVSFDDVKLIKYDFKWAGEHRKEIVDKWTKEVYSLPR